MFRALRFACWNAVRMRGKKLELEHFLNQHGVDTGLLNETFLTACQLYMPPHRQTDSGGGTTIMIFRGIIDNTVPILCPTHLETTAIQVLLAGKTLKILAVYLSLSPHCSERT